MLCGAVNLFLGLIALAHNKEQTTNTRANVQDSADKLADELAHKLANELVDQELVANDLQRADLENMTFGKPGFRHIGSVHADSSNFLASLRGGRAITTMASVKASHARTVLTQAQARPAKAKLDESEVRALEVKRARLHAELADLNRALEAGVAANTESVGKLGSRKSVFEPSFGYLSKSAGVYTDTESVDGFNMPSSALDLAIRNFKRELPELLDTLKGNQQVENDKLVPDKASEFREKLNKLVLDNDKVWAREKLRPAVEAPLVLLIPYYVLCWCLDSAFEGRPIARFWFLETVARIPYFAYVSSLHLYESLGWWRRSAEAKRVHFAEEWNEFHHLLTMEALGGDQLWQDRFLAQHAAIAYYWVLVGVWLMSPSLAYKFSELIEAHAVDTYAEFIDANRDILAELPAPRISRLYYNGPDLSLFDEFQTARPRGSRRPSCETLLDVFTNIRDDEAEHVATMAACQDASAAVTAPKVEAALLTTAAVGAAAFNLIGPDEVTDAINSATEAADLLTSPEQAAAGLTSVAAVAKDFFADTVAGAQKDVESSLTNEVSDAIGAAAEGADMAAMSEQAVMGLGAVAVVAKEVLLKGGRFVKR